MDNCAICLSGVDERLTCTMVPCGHVFHSICIQSWLVHKTECPMCRAAVSSSSCQHGELGAHETSVLMGVIESQKSIIETMKTEAQISSDTSFALEMRLEIIVQELQRNLQQNVMYGILVEGSQMMPFDVSNDSDSDDQ
jgi:hypothetical protein